MLVDGFTVVAQIINFLILVLLLRHFLYRPVMRAMREREAKIAAELEEARLLKQEAVEEAEAYRRQRRELDNEREALLSKAREEVDLWRKDAISKARAEVAEARAGWQKSSAAEKQAFIQHLRQTVGDQVIRISRRALVDLADSELEQQVIGVFLQRLNALDESERAMLRQSVDRSGGELVLRSAFDIPPDTRQLVLQNIRRNIAPDVEMRFEVIPGLLCGIEMSSQDYKLAWTLDDYLVSLEENLSETLSEVTERERHVQ